MLGWAGEGAGGAPLSSILCLLSSADTAQLCPADVKQGKLQQPGEHRQHNITISLVLRAASRGAPPACRHISQRRQLSRETLDHWRKVSMNGTKLI